MSPGEAVVQGVIQGATEFLPVSSSGHLRLAQSLFDAQPASPVFDIALHVGTLLAVVVFFRKDLFELVAAAFGKDPQRRRLGWGAVLRLVVASVPTAVIGLALEPLIIDRTLAPWVVGGFLVINAAVLRSTKPRSHADGANPAVSEKYPSTRQGWWTLPLFWAFAIGVAQGLAVAPGISRSGATIATALLLGLSWRPAAGLSFLLSIPAILGALLLKLDEFGTLDENALLNMGLGVGTAVLVGIGCLWLLLTSMRKAVFHHFAWYCLVLGLASIVWGLASGPTG